MQTTNLKNILEKEDINVISDFYDKLEVYTESLLETNKSLNLTAITDPHEVIIKHYYDSIYPLKLGLIDVSGRVVDVGCGAGFPSIVLRLALGGGSFTLMDASKKRLTFLDKVIAQLGLVNTVTLHMRAEDAGRDIRFREQFDTAVSRAVAALPILCEYCLPLVKTGGSMLAYKGDITDDELEQGLKAAADMGGSISKVYRYELPDNMGKRSIVLIKKESSTPEKYPRSAKKIKALKNSVEK